DGWVSRLREDFGPGAANFVVDHRLVEGGATPVEDALATRDADRYASPVRATSEDGTTVRVVERETGAASSLVVPSALFTSPIYANVRKTYARLAEVVGHPPVDHPIREM